MKITVRISTLTGKQNIIADDNTKTITYNGKISSVSPFIFIATVLKLVKNWQPNMVNPLAKDGEDFFVEINDGQNTRTYKGKNSFPDNYFRLKNLVKEVAKSC